MIQEKSYSIAIVLERPSFQNIWKKFGKRTDGFPCNRFFPLFSLSLCVMNLLWQYIMVTVFITDFLQIGSCCRFDENYGEAAKIQLKQAILWEVKQQLLNQTKEKGHLDELLHSLHCQISSLKSEINFLREEVKQKKQYHQKTAPTQLL